MPTTNELILSIDNISDLINTIRQFPEQEDALIECLTSDLAHFNRIFSKTISLQVFMNNFARHRDAVVNPILVNPENYPHCINNFTDLDGLLLVYPRVDYHEAFLVRVINDPVLFDRYITTCEELISCFLASAPLYNHDAFIEQYSHLLTTTEHERRPKKVEALLKTFIEGRLELIEQKQAFPDYIGMIIAKIIANDAVFKRLIPSGFELTELLEFLAKQAPQHAETLFTAFLSNHAVFNNAIGSASALTTLIRLIGAFSIINKLFSNKTLDDTEMHDIEHLPIKRKTFNRLLADRIAQNCPFPDYADLLIDRLKALSFEEYLIRINIHTLIQIAVKFKKQTAVKPCVSYSLSNTSTFLSFFPFRLNMPSTEKNLGDLAEMYPKIRILQSENCYEVYRKIDEYEKARSVARLVGQGSRSTTSVFSILNPNLLFKIVKRTVDSKNLDSNTLKAVVNNALVKPVM